MYPRKALKLGYTFKLAISCKYQSIVIIKIFTCPVIIIGYGKKQYKIALQVLKCPIMP